MKLAYLLSGRHSDLAEEEVFQLYKSYGPSVVKAKRLDRVLLVDQVGNRLPEFLDRLALVHEVVEVLDIVDKTRLVDSVVDIDIPKRMIGCVRVKKVGHHTENSEILEKTIGAELYKRGWKIDLKNPEVLLRVILVGNHAVIGIMIHKTDKKGFNQRNPQKRPFFRPGVMLPSFARALVNLTGIKKNELLLDPMCGTGSFLIESSLMGIESIGMDIQKIMVEGCLRNIKWCGQKVSVIQGDATSMPFVDNSVDGLVTDFPYGRSSRMVGETTRFVREVMEEVARVMKKHSKGVFVIDRELKEYLPDELVIVKVFEDRVHKSLIRKVHLCEKD
jgi:tRNA (guanine10-N2)-dimethyltransferase